ncbi:MAG: trigger factor [Myxococcota bacterium]|nr:trigger factor [Myxococcota bacterium]
MQFEILEKSSVRKQVNIEVPAKRVDSTFAAVYNQLAQKASLPGFRKGKVPLSHVRKLYGNQAKFTVTEKLVDAGWRELLNEHDVIPLSEPELGAVEPVKAGQSYKFSMSFDVAPTIELDSFDKIDIERENWTASDEVVDNELEQLAEHVSEFEAIEDRSIAEDGDQAIIDYAGSIDGEAFAGGTATDAPLVLGSGQFIPGFEEQIVGKTVGDSFDVHVAFPDDYHAENLKGQAAVFACTLKELKAKVPVAIGPELAEKMGEADLDALRAKLKTEIEDRYNSKAISDARDKLRDRLGEEYQFDVPPSLFKSSLEDHRKSMIQDAMRNGQSAEEAQADVNNRIGDEEDKVRQDIRAYLVIDAVARAEKIDVSEEDMREEFQKMMMTMGPYAQQIMQMYRNPEHRAELTRRIRHDKVLDFLLTQANVTTADRDIPGRESET